MLHPTFVHTTFQAISFHISLDAMDFAAAMSAQLGSSSPSMTEVSKNYPKKSDLEAKRQAEYRKEQEALERERDNKAAKKRKLEAEEAERKQERKEE